MDQSSASSDVGNAVAVCPASLRFKEPSRPEATIIPACRARHGHHRALYTSTDSELIIGEYNVQHFIQLYSTSLGTFGLFSFLIRSYPLYTVLCGSRV